VNQDASSGKTLAEGREKKCGVPQIEGYDSSASNRSHDVGDDFLKRVKLKGIGEIRVKSLKLDFCETLEGDDQKKKGKGSNMKIKKISKCRRLTFLARTYSKEGGGSGEVELSRMVKSVNARGSLWQGGMKPCEGNKRSGN